MTKNQFNHTCIYNLINLKEIQLHCQYSEKSYKLKVISLFIVKSKYHMISEIYTNLLQTARVINAFITGLILFQYIQTDRCDSSLEKGVSVCTTSATFIISVNVQYHHFQSNLYFLFITIIVDLLVITSLFRLFAINIGLLNISRVKCLGGHKTLKL